MIEHGLYFAEYVLKDECIMPCIDTIYTYSNYRKNAILKEFGKNFDKEIIMVGPYIQYADYFKSKDKLKIAMIYTTSTSFLNVLTKWRKIMIQFLFQ